MLQSVDVTARANDPRGADLAEAAHDVVARLAPGFEVNVRAGEVNAIRVNGKPIGARDRDQGDTPAWMIEAAVAHALEPRHILFLCVANSARSQMAEVMARALAPSSVTISSAGSAPSQVRPEAIAVLEELNLDASGQRSKAVADLDTDTVQLVITLCADEVCPTVLQPIPQLHWAFTDPAATTGDAAARLAAFRETRDAIRERLYVLFNG